MAYKRRFSDDDVERMEQDADAAGRITAAERRMALAGNSFNNRNNQIADLAAAARERRLASRSHFVTMNPGAVSPQERASLAQERLTGRERALQEHERGMLGDKIKGEVKVAHEKRLGMENQGVGAAKINAAVTTEGNRSRFGFFDENGVYHPGSDVQSAEARGLADFEKNFLTNQTKLDIANSNNATKRDIATGNNDTKRDITSENNDTKRAIEEQKRLAEKERFEKNLKYKYERLDEQTRKNVDDAADKLIKNSDGKLSLEDARAQVMAGREQAQQQGGNITTDSTGAKWEIVKDANGKPIGKRRVQ